MNQGRMGRNATKLVLLTSLLVACWSLERTAIASGAKALFYDEGGVSVGAEAAKHTAQKKKKAARPAAASARKDYMGLSYWIDLVDANGNAVRTTTSRVFHSGDRIKLNLKSNRNGYLYVVGVGPTGTSRVLFPNSEGVANGIRAKTTYAVPFDSALRFDDTPGEERLLVFLSEKPLPQIAAGQKILPARETQQLVASAQAPGSKDLVVEEESGKNAVEPASYAVVPVSALGDSRTLSLQIKLKHQ